MPVPILLSVFFALVFLTIVTVAQASVDFGNYDVLIVMGIATVKATLVGYFFMHLSHEKPFNVALFLGSLVFCRAVRDLHTQRQQHDLRFLRAQD